MKTTTKIKTTWLPLTLKATPQQLILKWKCHQGSKPEREFHMMNITYAALRMHIYTKRRHLYATMTNAKLLMYKEGGQGTRSPEVQPYSALQYFLSNFSLKTRSWLCFPPVTMQHILSNPCNISSAMHATYPRQCMQHILGNACNISLATWNPLTKINQKEVNCMSGILHTDLTWRKKTFDKRGPLMEDYLRWRSTFDGKLHLMEDYLCWRQPLKQNDL